MEHTAVSVTSTQIRKRAGACREGTAGADAAPIAAAAAAIDMEITGPERASVQSSINVTVKGLAKVESIALDDAVVGAKLAGCKGISVRTLLARVRPQMGNGVSGTFVAADGAATDPIDFDELVRGWLVHSDSTGSNLPASLGGPLRVVYPSGCAVQSSVCKTKTSPVNLKGAVRLELLSAFELKDQKIAKALSSLAPRLILELETNHIATLRAIARHYCGVEQPLTRVAITALDARGLTMCVTSASGEVTEGLLAPFPRPITDESDVLPRTMEMHKEAFSALPASFKLASGYYTEPLQVACRRTVKAAVKSPHAPLFAAAALAATVGLALSLRVIRARR